MEETYNKELPIAQGSIQNPYNEFDVVLAASGQFELSYVHDYFRILTYTGTSGDLKVRFGGSGSESTFSGAGIGYELIQPVDRVYFRNSGVGSITLKVALAVGRIYDDRLNVSGTITVGGTVAVSSVAGTVTVTGSVTVSGTVAVSSVSGTVAVAQTTNTTALTSAAVTVTTSATTILAASGTRKNAVIYNNDASAVLYIGSASVTTSNGIPIAAGGSYSNINDGAAYYGIVASGSVNVRVLEN